ncbi:hypothetical protein Bca4012_083905 [Brassica carinata]|uniref:Uncharacterized protein n=1 Tax=Brassica carinata TaxID=52824 RepID=A0A8X7V8C1_BRACI|nr:hypothetical protein Bca52824_026873 [Brassica carinata]
MRRSDSVGNQTGHIENLKISLKSHLLSHISASTSTSSITLISPFPITEQVYVNKKGDPLLEIVFDPDIRSGIEAAEYTGYDNVKRCCYKGLLTFGTAFPYIVVYHLLGFKPIELKRQQ